MSRKQGLIFRATVLLADWWMLLQHKSRMDAVRESAACFQDAEALGTGTGTPADNESRRLSESQVLSHKTDKHGCTPEATKCVTIHYHVHLQACKGILGPVTVNRF